MNLNDLPDEVLEQIFDHLDLYELKIASLVCSRWAKVTFSGQRMDRVWFVLGGADWKSLLKIKRPYRNIRHSEGPFERLSRFLQTMKLPVRMLQFDYVLTFEELRLILLKVPELQHFSIRDYIDYNCKTNEPFPVLTKLKCLNLSNSGNNQFDFFRMNVANLQSLYMTCATNRDLEAWRYMSGQLKFVYVYESNSTYFSLFLELTFPHLEDFTMRNFSGVTAETIATSRSHGFFRRHSLLRRLSVSVPISVEWIRSIASHCPELTYLSLFLMNPEEGILESLVQLTKLRTPSNIVLLSGEKSIPQTGYKTVSRNLQITRIS
ncbi:uncharacterized protein LOC128268962 isoform X2 [Anopheles cruzii]|uniref:uncharacterized protein LOC128268962 isoform X2 n=1 Tax=Anopheles cruzii TaxID=68878 RepID=UPI0022EC6BEC|nr:uncharacterized protein LOC128268962 isoform X2 [Anopheles cruzii]